jgi:hypothetical protein
MPEPSRSFVEFPREGFEGFPLRVLAQSAMILDKSFIDEETVHGKSCARWHRGDSWLRRLFHHPDQ